MKITSFVVCLLIFSLICWSSVNASTEGDAPLKLDELGKKTANGSPVTPSNPNKKQPEPVDKNPVSEPKPKPTNPKTNTTDPNPKPNPVSCPKNETVYIDVYKKVYKKVYTPHLVHYSPHQYVTSNAAVYLTKLIKGIKQLNFNLARYKRITEHLNKKKLIVETLYKKHTEFQEKMILKIENALSTNKGSIKFAKKHLSILKDALEKLHYDSNLPENCHDIKNDKCSTKPKNVGNGVKVFTQKNLFSFIKFTKFPAKIENLQIHENIANYVKHGSEWFKKVVKVNSKLVRLIKHQTIEKLMENDEIKKQVEKYMSVLKFKNSNEEFKTKLSFIKKSYSTKYENEVKSILSKKYVKKLKSEKYPNKVIETKGKGRLTKEMISLPEIMLKKKNLKKLLLTRFDIE
eukprot:gene8594-419_t